VHVVVTSSEDAAGPRDRVTDEERQTVEWALREGGVPYRYEPTLRGAMREVLDGWGDDDLVLLLGAQGMDQAARLAREYLG
jgi:UDP-N-acetylmuramoyl-L-alanyl-D-glutamate--2,6-diaminopimelate ligase